MNITLIIAIAGCITGVLSLIIEAASFLSGRTHLEVGTFSPLENMIHKKTYLDGDDATTVFKCFLNLQMINTGGRYAIIQDVYMRRPGCKGKKTDDMVAYHGVYSRAVFLKRVLCLLTWTCHVTIRKIFFLNRHSV